MNLTQTEIERANQIAATIRESAKVQAEIEVNNGGPKKDPTMVFEAFCVGIAVAILYILRPEFLWDRQDVIGTDLYEIVRSSFVV